MAIHLPLIAGTSYDDVLNEFIGFVNSVNNSNQPSYAAHAASAIAKFLMIKHETGVGLAWVQKTIPLIGDIKIYDHLVDKLYVELLAHSI